MENNNKKLYSKKEYAVLKGKFPSQTTKWVKEGKLKMQACEKTAKFYILDCEENDNFINNLSVGRPKKDLTTI